MFPLYDENRPLRRPYVNYLLLIVNITIFFFFFLQGWKPMRNAIVTYGAIPVYILKGKRFETLFTSMFMHADILHLAGNMIYLWVFGDNIEDTLGHGKYLLFYLVGGLAATFAHIASSLLPILVTGLPYFAANLSIPSVGASGAISTVLGAYLVLFPRAKIRTLIFYIFVTIVRVPAVYYLGFWFLQQLLFGLISLTGLTSSVAFWAHIGGFVFGMVVVKALNIKPGRKTVIGTLKPTVTPAAAPWIRTPLVDVLVEVERVIVIANLPGVNEEDINIELSENQAVISARHGNIKYYKQLALPARVYPRVENLVYNNGTLFFVLYRML